MRTGRGNAGSGLIVVLAMLAMMAIMATTFVMLMRIDVRIAANYADEQKCELLASGALNYFKAILRDDLDRTWGKYENRDTAVGVIGYEWNGVTSTSIPGLNEDKYGAPVSNDFWFNCPLEDTWSDYGILFPSESGIKQYSFFSGTGNSRGAVVRYWDDNHSREVQIWNGRTLCRWHPNIAGVMVDDEYPSGGQTVDFDGDGTPRPAFGSGGFTNQEASDTNLYYNAAAFVLYSGNNYYFPGALLSGENSLPRGLVWRWAAKLGVPHGMYIDMNTAGNVLGTSGYLNNIGGIGLHALRAEDETASQVPSQHLGRPRWKGFPNEKVYDCQSVGGFPRFFDEVYYHPSQVSLEKLFCRDTYAGVSYAPTMDNGNDFNLALPRQPARDLINYRLGGDGHPADGSDRYNPGWRRDGGTYYRMLSPENPTGDDRFFGMNEVMEHDHATYDCNTSEMAKALTPGQWRKLRPYVTFWSADTILRGKIWPKEGPPYTSAEGDWHSMDILKRVNLNMIGAKGAEGLTGEDANLKSSWGAKRNHECDRLYYMLRACMAFTQTPNAQAQAAQFIASLSDMIDRDQDENWYAPPDGTPGALGMEKHPVINEIVLYANDARPLYDCYTLSHFRIELYNPMENIPWIPDDSEAIDIHDYRLTVKAPGFGRREYVLSNMQWYPAEDMTAAQGAPTQIKADGVYGYYPYGFTWHPTQNVAIDPSWCWSRYLDIGWTTNMPPDMKSVTDPTLQKNAIQEFKAGVVVALWKPIRDAAAAAALTEDGVNVATVAGVKCLCVDRTDLIKLLPPYDATYQSPGTWGGLNESMYMGIYRRWDPMNARLYSESPVGQCERNNVLWLPGWSPWFYSTLGRPNAGYPRSFYKNAYTTWSKWDAAGKKDFSTSRYYRWAERNFKIVDGDLPSVGWLGELMMWNLAKDGPLTWCHSQGQIPLGAVANGDTDNWYFIERDKKLANELDTKAKFDLFRPFRSAGVYHPYCDDLRPDNLQMLDIFTTWDPSNDGIDNDGDGAVDGEDTGLQPGDKCGPEVRVFGRIDINNASRRVAATVFPDNQWADNPVDGRGQFCTSLKSGPKKQRYSLARTLSGSSSTSGGGWGAIDTIGDILRADRYHSRPGVWMAGGTLTWEDGPYTTTNSWASSKKVTISERGFTGYSGEPNPASFTGDDDGDGIIDERDERDMIFTWVANHITTRSNVFEVDLLVDLCEPPPYKSGSAGPLPFKSWQTRRSYAKKQVLAVFDRSTSLRINATTGRCDFTGPVETRSIRFTDDRKTY